MKKKNSPTHRATSSNHVTRVVTYSFLRKLGTRLRTFSEQSILILTTLTLVSAVYLPVIGVRTLRFAGDEKSYLAQVVEMKDRSNWFKQTFAGVPCYYKGPFHYIAVRGSALIFGNTFWSALFPNFIFLLLSSVAVTMSFLRFHPQRKDWALLSGIAFATCAGLYTHGLASQMEIELAGVFAIGMFALAWNRTLFFWIAAGAAGWMKSPLHSVLLGSAGLFYWFSEGTLFTRLKTPRQWFFLLTGVALCSAGYAPAFLLDHDNFINTYIHRETFDKPSNSGPWWSPILPILTHSVFPWTVLIWTGLLGVLVKIVRRSPLPKGALLGICLAAPSVLFFLIHPFRVHTYNLPIICGLLLIACSMGANIPASRSGFFRISLASIPAFLSLALVAAVILVKKIQIPFFSSPILVLCAVLSLVEAIVAVKIFTNRIRLFKSPATLVALATVPPLIIIGLLLRSLGEWELTGFNTALAHLSSQNGKQKILYLDPVKSAWNEWGLMVFATGREIRPVYSIEGAVQALKMGDSVISQKHSEIEEIQKLLKLQASTENLQIENWPRWRRPAESQDGIPAWKRALIESDWKKLVTDFSVMKLRK